MEAGPIRTDRLHTPGHGKRGIPVEPDATQLDFSGRCYPRKSGPGISLSCVPSLTEPGISDALVDCCKQMLDILS